MGITIALAGNPNCGKTTLFNALTGSNQFVGNWPGVTVEKKEGKLKKRSDVTVTDLPGVYSLSPYTLEEVVARNYLLNERPDVILNIIDGTNIERNLYLTTQLAELGIPVVGAVNMMDIVNKKGDVIDLEKLGEKLGCKMVAISALKGDGIDEAAQLAIEMAGSGEFVPKHSFSGPVEHALAHIEEAAVHELDEASQRWYSIKLFERDEKIMEQMKLSKEMIAHINKDIEAVEKEMDDEAESIITNERYEYITGVIKTCYKRNSDGKPSVSEKIDRIVTNRFLALPIFAVIMFLVYYVSISTIGTGMTDWVNNSLFGEGFHLFGISGTYEEKKDAWADEYVFTDEVSAVIDEACLDENIKGAEEIKSAFDERDFGAFEENYSLYAEEFYKNKETGGKVYDITAALGEALDGSGEFTAPDPSDYGKWVPGIPVLLERGLNAINCGEWLKSLVIDGIAAGVGAVLGFLPQMLVLFIFLAFLEACGYMSRVAFIMDKLFRRIGLSGKSFIPILIGTGCGVPGIMASRTIENERDRRMTIITTTFIPCGAKLPVISMIAAALFGGAWWVGPSAYFLGMAAIVISGIMLKKTKPFMGEPAPFVMELPAYHMPTVGAILSSMWERGWSFIKKAGTVILLASIVIWAGSVHGWKDGASFGFYPGMLLSDSILGHIGDAIKIIFVPLGFGNAAASVATIMGLIAKEEIVGVFGVLGFDGLSPLAGYSFLAFNLLCAPCVAAMSAIRREMNSAKWTAFALMYQCGFAYAAALVMYQFGLLFIGEANVVGLTVACIVIAFIAYMLFRPYKEPTKLEK